MKYSPSNYKKDLKRFNELALLLKVKQKDKKAPKNKKLFQKVEQEYQELSEKLQKDYDEKHKKELHKLEQKEKAEKSVAAAIQHTIETPIYDHKGKLVSGVDKEAEEKAKIDKAVMEKIKEIEKLQDDDIERAEKLYEDELKEIKEETIITTNPDGSKTVEVKKKIVKPDIYMQEPRYTKNQLRHRKFYEGKEEREDLSETVKEIFDKRVKSAGIPPAKFVGKAGGKRKILACPHCDGEMIATGVKATTTDNTRAKTPAMTSWHALVKAVGEMPEHKGMKRPLIMPIASAIKKHYDGDNEKALQEITGGRFRTDMITNI